MLKDFYLHWVVRIIPVYVSYLETEPKSDKVIPSKSSSKSVLEKNVPVSLDHIGLYISFYLWTAPTIRIYYLYFH